MRGASVPVSEAEALVPAVLAAALLVLLEVEVVVALEPHGAVRKEFRILIHA